MTLRMWIVELDQYGLTDRKLSMDDPIQIPRKGEFIDGGFDGPSGWVDLVQWNISDSVLKTVYVFVRKEKQ